MCVCRGRERDGWGINMAQLRGYSSWGSTVIDDSGYRMTKRAQALTAQALWLCNSSMPISLREFESEPFRNS